MERITDRTPEGLAYIRSETGKEGVGTITTQRRLPQIIAKLAYYEDLEEQGKIFILPCKLGDTVYRVIPECAASAIWCRKHNKRMGTKRCSVKPCEAYIVETQYNLSLHSLIGIDIFLSKDDAKRAIKERYYK